MRTIYDVHGVRTSEEYRRFHAESLRAQRQRFPFRHIPEPWICVAPRAVYIAFGKWLLRCLCGNAPVVDPASGLCCCLECGAVYEHCAVPIEWRAIEAALGKRPSLASMNMRPGETVADLDAENILHGVA